ncbi:MAG: DUF692 domain-containing protein [Pseudomonadota bacterium]
MSTHPFPVNGAGLGLRRALLGPLQKFQGPLTVDFWEVAPENWINVGGALGRQFRSYTERFPFVCHGLSLSLGGPDPLDETFLRKVRTFLDTHNIRCYSEHLSYCTDGGHLYDLMPIPFTEDAINHTVERIQRTQDIVGRRIAIENVSFYAAPGSEMDEIDFVREVLTRADCQLLLDVNNIYVNSINHGYDAETFLAALPGERVAYCHVAGHYNEAEDLIVDTHGGPVIDPVWKLLESAFRHFGPLPALVERDFNFPPIPELLGEVQAVRDIQAGFLPDQGWPRAASL